MPDTIPPEESIPIPEEIRQKGKIAPGIKTVFELTELADRESLSKKEPEEFRSTFLALCSENNTHPQDVLAMLQLIKALDSDRLNELEGELAQSTQRPLSAVVKKLSEESLQTEQTEETEIPDHTTSQAKVENLPEHARETDAQAAKDEDEEYIPLPKEILKAPAITTILQLHRMEIKGIPAESFAAEDIASLCRSNGTNVQDLLAMLQLLDKSKYGYLLRLEEQIKNLREINEAVTP